MPTWLVAGFALIGALVATAAAWRHLYWLMMAAQLGIAGLYFLR